ncbi:IPT/TIG domain-containing protein [Acidobacteriota bacterium]
MKYHTNRSVLALLCLFIGLSIFSTAAGQIKRQGVRKPLNLKLPDLTVSVICPETAFAGQDLRKSIRVKISNIGTAEAKNFDVAIFIAKDKSDPKQPLVFSQKFKPYVLLQGGQENIRTLAAGATTWVTLRGPNKIPSDTPSGKYVIGVFVDSLRSVREMLDQNNIDWGNILVGPHISNVTQSFSFQIAPMREITISGNGFGFFPGNKILKMGSYNLTLLSGGWNINEIWCIYPGGVPHGEHYSVYIMNGGNIISNQFDFFLKMVIFKGEFIPFDGPPGTSLSVGGMMMGSFQGQKKLMFGNTEAQVQSWNNSVIQCTIPSLPPGTYDVYIKKNGITISGVVQFTITSN